MTEVAKVIQNEVCQDCNIELEQVGLYFKLEDFTLCAHCADNRGFEVN